MRSRASFLGRLFLCALPVAIGCASATGTEPTNRPGEGPPEGAGPLVAGSADGGDRDAAPAQVPPPPQHPPPPPPATDAGGDARRPPSPPPPPPPPPPS